MENKQFLILLITIFCGLFGPGVGHADLLESKAPITVSDLDAVMQEGILLKAQADRERQRAELGKFKSATESIGISGAQEPRLAWRRSTASGWLAKFILADGASVIASVGEQLPGGYMVAQINADGVQLERDGIRVDPTAAPSSTRGPTGPTDK